MKLIRGIIIVLVKRLSLTEILVCRYCFDYEDYLKNNPDLQSLNFSPLIHYLAYGQHEGRDYSSNFSRGAYPHMSKSPLFKEIVTGANASSNGQNRSALVIFD